MKGIFNLVVSCTQCMLTLAGGLAAGSCWAAVAQPGDLIVTEVMANPSAVSDTTGEWLELYNAAGVSVELTGLTLSDDGANSHAITDAVVIDPGEYFVMGRDGDTTVNGGFTADYVYDGFTLSNSADEVVLADGVDEILRLDYASGSAFGAAGVSAELAPGAVTPFVAGDYQLTPDTFVYGAGDVGTPGGPGSYTPTVAPVPVPAAVWLFGAGLIGLTGVARRRRR